MEKQVLWKRDDVKQRKSTSELIIFDITASGLKQVSPRMIEEDWKQLEPRPKQEREAGSQSIVVTERP
jgi:hypothetical protein